MGISPITVREIFNFSDNSNYNLRSGTHLSRPFVHTTHYGKESITNLGAKIWELILQNIKEENSLSIKLPMSPCKTYIAQVGFI